MYILHVTYNLKEGKMAEWLAALRVLQVAEKTRREAGNIEYAYYVPADGSNKVLLVELWENRDFQQAHLKSPHLAELAKVKEEFVESVDLKAYTAE
jgi:quinol monooxygenase YgiN